MPRYYFDTYDGVQVLADEFGDEFHSDIEAASQASSLIPDFVRDNLSKQDSFYTAVSLRNDCGEVIYRSVSVIASQWPTQGHFSYRVKINEVDFVMSQSRMFRDNARELSDRMRVSVTNIFRVIESAMANVETSRKLLRGGEA